MFYNAIIYHRWVISTRGQRYNTHMLQHSEE